MQKLQQSEAAFVITMWMMFFFTKLSFFWRKMGNTEWGKTRQNYYKVIHNAA